MRRNRRVGQDDQGFGPVGKGWKGDPSRLSEHTGVSGCIGRRFAKQTCLENNLHSDRDKDLHGGRSLSVFHPSTDRMALQLPLRSSCLAPQMIPASSLLFHKKSGSEILLSIHNCSRAKGDEGTRPAFILCLALPFRSAFSSVKAGSNKLNFPSIHPTLS